MKLKKVVNSFSQYPYPRKKAINYDNFVLKPIRKKTLKETIYKYLIINGTK